jgi:hypothetical protein
VRGKIDGLAVEPREVAVAVCQNHDLHRLARDDVVDELNQPRDPIATNMHARVVEQEDLRLSLRKVTRRGQPQANRRKLATSGRAVSEQRRVARRPQVRRLQVEVQRRADVRTASEEP